MNVLDPQKIAEAAAKMRRPELHLNPADIGRLFEALTPTEMKTERDRALDAPATSAPLSSLPVRADASVECGHMWLVDADPEPLEWVTPTSIEPGMLEAIDRARALERRLDEFISGAFLLGMDGRGRP